MANAARRTRVWPALLAILWIGCGPADPLEEALRMQAQGNYHGSIPVLRTLLDERPDDTQVHYLYGRALTATGQASLAEWSLRRAAEDPEWLVPAGTQLAVSALQAGNFDTAVSQATRVLEAEPENIDAMLIRAQAYARSRMHGEEAIAETDRIFALDPDNADAMEPRIQALLGLERIDEAEEAIEELGRMIEENPDASEWVRGWHCATTALFAQDSGEDELAQARWEDCLERFPGHSNVVSKALTYFDSRADYRRSLEILQAAIEAEPQSIDLRRRLAFRARHLDGPEAAEAILVEGTEIAAPRHLPTAYHILAKHYQDLGRHEAAVEAMGKAVEASRAIDAMPPQLLFDYADAMILQGDMDGALAVTEEMTLEPHRELIRARIAQERGDHLAALGHYDEAFRLWPDNPWARYLAALSAEAVGQFDRAVELYRYAIRIQTDATDARYRLAKLHTDEGKPTEGLAILKIDAKNSPLTIEGELLGLELSTWGGEQGAVAEQLQRFAQAGPTNFGRALAALGRGAHARFGAEAAVQVLERYRAGSLDVQDPDRPDGFHALIELQYEAGDIAALEPAVRAAVAAHPDAAGARTLLGHWLERSGASPEDVRAAYEAALAIDPTYPRALAGIGRQLAETDPEKALEAFSQAADGFGRAGGAGPAEVEASLAAARLLVRLGRPDEAAARLRTALASNPHSADVSMMLVDLQLTGNTVDAETQALAERAVRFEGGVEALERLARVYRKRDDPKRATEIEARVRGIRASQASEPTPPA